MEDSIQKIVDSQEVHEQMRTTVSRLAYLFPSLFMQKGDPAKMVQSLDEKRNPSEYPTAEEIQKQKATPMYEEVDNDNIEQRIAA